MPKSAIVRFRKRRAKEPAPRARSNPPFKHDFVAGIAPAFLAYGATKLLARIVGVLVSRRFPRAGRHLAAISSVAAFGAAWFGAHRWKRLQPYHWPIVIGSGVAALQAVAQTYVPKYGWILSDWTPADQAALPAAAPGAAAPALAPAGDEFSYLEAELEGTGAEEAAMTSPTTAYTPTPNATALTPAEQKVYDQAVDGLDGVLGDDDADDLGALATGVFAN